MSRYASDTAEKLWAAKRQAPVITDYIPPQEPYAQYRMEPMEYRPRPFMDEYWQYSMGNTDDDNAASKFGGNKLDLLFASGMDLLNGFGGNNVGLGLLNGFGGNNTDMEAQRRHDEMYRQMMRAQQEPYGQFRR